jgi:hypothetical protein
LTVTVEDDPVAGSRFEVPQEVAGAEEEHAEFTNSVTVPAWASPWFEEASDTAQSEPKADAGIESAMTVIAPMPIARRIRHSVFFLAR